MIWGTCKKDNWRNEEQQKQGFGCPSQVSYYLFSVKVGIEQRIPRTIKSEILIF